MKKILLIVAFALLFSCEKEQCRICITKTFVVGKTYTIKTDTVCYKIEEGYFYTKDSSGYMNLKMVVCE
jgi:hypothetical protein